MASIGYNVTGIFTNRLFARFRRWMFFWDPHVQPVHCGSRKSIRLELEQKFELLETPLYLLNEIVTLL